MDSITHFTCADVGNNSFTFACSKMKGTIFYFVSIKFIGRFLRNTCIAMVRLTTREKPLRIFDSGRCYMMKKRGIIIGMNYQTHNTMKGGNLKEKTESPEHKGGIPSMSMKESSKSE